MSGTIGGGPTRYPAANAVVAVLLAELRRALGGKLAGCYLYGSAATGDFVEGVSDVDLLAVLADDLADAEYAGLGALHQDFAQAHPEWDDRIEVAYVTVVALRSFRTQTSSIAVVSPGEPFHRKDAGMDWLANWYLVRETGITLAGSLPQEFIGPIGKDEYVAAIADYARWLGERIEQAQRRKEQAYAILTLCRAGRMLATGEYGSKTRAAAWAASEWPAWAGLIARAVAWRLAEDDASEAKVPEEVRRFVVFAVEECARWRGQSQL